MTPTSSFRIAVKQIGAAPQSQDDVERLLNETAASAVAGGAGLVLLPELALSAYGNPDVNRRLAMTEEQATAIAGTAARRSDVAILAGYCERDRDIYFNAAILVSAAGRRLVNYRKMHLWGPYEREVFAPGNPAGVIQLAPSLKVGLLICHDLDHPATAQDLVARGANLVLVLSAITHPYEVVPLIQVPARAYENSAFVAFCTQSGMQEGLHFAGLSTVAAPDGSILARARPDAADLVFADIDTAAFEVYRENHSYADQLRRDLYPAPKFLGIEA